LLMEVYVRVKRCDKGHRNFLYLHDCTVLSSRLTPDDAIGKGPWVPLLPYHQHITRLEAPWEYATVPEAVGPARRIDRPRVEKPVV
jgi:hypothetical protein